MADRLKSYWGDNTINNNKSKHTLADTNLTAVISCMTNDNNNNKITKQCDKILIETLENILFSGKRPP